MPSGFRLRETPRCRRPCCASPVAWAECKFHHDGVRARATKTGRLAFGASASVQSLQCHAAAESRRRRSRQDFAKGNDTIARLMLVGGVANETGFCYVTGLGWGRRRPLRAWEPGKLWRDGSMRGRAGALGGHWDPLGPCQRRQRGAQPPPSAIRQWSRWPRGDKMGRKDGLPCDQWGKRLLRAQVVTWRGFFSIAPPSSTCAQAEGITGAASQRCPAPGLGTGTWTGCCFHSSLLHKTTRIWSHLAMLGMDQSYRYTYSSSQLALSRARFPSFVSRFSIPHSPRILQPSPLDPFPSLPPDLDPTCALLIARHTPSIPQRQQHNLLSQLPPHHIFQHVEPPVVGPWRCGQHPRTQQDPPQRRGPPDAHPQDGRRHDGPRWQRQHGQERRPCRDQVAPGR